MKSPVFPDIKFDDIKFDGGLDVVTPPLKIPSGFVRHAQNYEVGVNGGYKGVKGYERYDGHAKPSNASYAILNATITGSYAVGNTLTGVTSGATGVIAAATATSFILTKVSGTFHAVSETLNISGSPVATSSGTQVTDGATTAKLHAQYRNAAADIYRADIAAVPGSGTVLGVWMLNDVLYAVRNNAGGTAAVLHKQSASGWTSVTMFYEVSFTAGSGTPPAEAATITKGANSATVKRVVLQSGSWSGGTAAGRFIVTQPTPGSFTAGAFTAGVTATCSGAETAITLTAGGRYETYTHNFGSGKRIYGASGVQRGFEFDGTVYVPISTGMATDTPLFVCVHKSHLFFAFAGSAQHSGIGTPYTWTILSGAAELAMGDTITGFVGQPGSEAAGGALAIFSRNRIGVLYGSSSSNWNLTSYADEQGALSYSAQRIVGNTLMLDDRGITNLQASQVYGNFSSAAISQRVQPWLTPKIGSVKASCVARDKNQYRLFFADKSALFITLNGNKLKGITPVLFLHTVECIWSGEKNDGTEAIFFGSSDGFVYQMENGTSFDGGDIETFLWLVFNSSKTVRQRKRYKRAAFEVAGDGYAEFNFRYELGYATTDIVQPSNQSTALDFAPSYWDTAVWDSFIWDGTALAPSSLSMEGTAENVSLILGGKSDYFAPLNFSGCIIHYIPRRGLR